MNFVPRMDEIIKEVINGKVIDVENAAVLVSDIVKSSELVEKTERAGECPFAKINKVLSPIAETIESYGGIVIGFHGDCVHAIFTGESAALRAYRAAAGLEIEPDPKIVNDEIIKIRIGLSFGNFKLGPLGPPNNRRIEPLGDTVNQAFKACRNATLDLRAKQPGRAYLSLTEPFADEILRTAGT